MNRSPLSHAARLGAVLLFGSAVACTGPAGTSGLVRIDAEPAGDNCASGGSAVHAGLDADGDGKLSDEETTSTEYICHGAGGADGSDGTKGNDGADGSDGAPGADGEDGARSLVRVDPEAAGDNCASGGVAVRSGVDEDGDGELDEDEAGDPTYVCNGAASVCAGVEPLVVESVVLEPVPAAIDDSTPPGYISGETYNVRMTLSGGNGALTFDYVGTGATLSDAVPVDGEAGAYDFGYTPSWSILERDNAIIVSDGCSAAVGTFTVGLVIPNPWVDVTVTPPVHDWGGGTSEVCWHANDLLTCYINIGDQDEIVAGKSGCVSVDVTEDTGGTVECGSLSSAETEFSIGVGPTVTRFEVIEPEDTLPSGGGDVVLAWDAYFVTGCTLFYQGGSDEGPTETAVPASSAGHTVAITENTDFWLSCAGVDEEGAALEVFAPSGDFVIADSWIDSFNVSISPDEVFATWTTTHMDDCSLTVVDAGEEELLFPDIGAAGEDVPFDVSTLGSPETATLTCEAPDGTTRSSEQYLGPV